MACGLPVCRLRRASIPAANPLTRGCNEARAPAKYRNVGFHDVLMPRIVSVRYASRALWRNDGGVQAASAQALAATRRAIQAQALRAHVPRNSAAFAGVADQHA